MRFFLFPWNGWTHLITGGQIVAPLRSFDFDRSLDQAVQAQIVDEIWNIEYEDNRDGP